MTRVRKLYTFADPQLDSQVAEIVRGFDGRMSNPIPVYEEVNGVPTLVGFKSDGTVASLITLLDGQLRASQLYADLNSRIDLIDTPTTGLVAQVSGITAAIDALNASIADLNTTPAYDGATTYAADDTVTYSGGLYVAIQATTGNVPTNATYWKKIGEYSSLSGAVAAHSVSISDHTTRIGTAEGNITSQAGSIATLVSGVGDNTAGISDERLARTTADSALSERIDAMVATTEDNAAAILEETRVRTNADGAIAQDVETLQTTVGDHTLSLQVNSESIDGLSGKYTVKIDNNGYVTGYGLASVSNQGVVVSEFMVVADKFSIAPVATSPSAADGSPFYCLTSPTIINGVTIPAGVYMKAAYIADASIDNAKIGNIIRSAVYTPGSAGWQINKAGTVEFNGGIFRGKVVFGSESSGYSNLTDKPTTLAAVDSTAATKLGTIATGAQVNPADLAALDSTAASTLATAASNASAAVSATSHWVKPGQTTIDGNKIYTGDAFIYNAMIRDAAVGTLSIAGDAVTLSVAGSNDNLQLASASWASYLSITVSNNPGVATLNINLIASLVAKANWRQQTENFSYSQVQCRVVNGAGTVISGPFLVVLASADLSEGNYISGTITRTLKATIGAGLSDTYYLQIIDTHTGYASSTGYAVYGSLLAIGGKR